MEQSPAWKANHNWWPMGTVNILYYTQIDCYKSRNKVIKKISFLSNCFAACSRTLDSLTVIQLVKELPAFYWIQRSFKLLKRLFHEFPPTSFRSIPVLLYIWEDHNCECYGGNCMAKNRQALVWGNILTLVRRKRGVGKKESQPPTYPQNTHTCTYTSTTSKDNIHTRYR